jgi:hypothetical protein
MLPFERYRGKIFPASSVRHREQQHPAIGLIHEDRQIRKLIDGHPKRGRAGQAECLNGLERATERVDD